jgi:hypothetical protein
MHSPMLRTSEITALRTGSNIKADELDAHTDPSCYSPLNALMLLCEN